MKSLSIQYIVEELIDIIKKKPEDVVSFSIINFTFLQLFVLFVKSSSSYLFLPWVCVYYAFWFAFFRFYYHKKPIVFTKKIFGTLVPSTKIIVICFILCLGIILLPYIPLLMGYNDEYALFVDKYMSSIQTIGQTESIKGKNISPLFVFDFLLFLLSPLIFVRPMFAWISSVIGRSGAISNAFNNTKGNYFNFLLLMLLFDLPFELVHLFFEKYALNESIMWFLCSPILVLGNYAIAKAYDFFFLNIDNAEQQSL